MSFLSRMRPSEALTGAFVVLLIGTALLFAGKIVHLPRLLSLYLLLLMVQVGLVLRRPASGAAGAGSAGIFRSVIFPIIAVLLIFDSLEMLVHSINPRDIDPQLIRLDYLIFGTYPTVALEALNHPLLTDILQIAYSSYYFLPISLCVLLKIRRRVQEFDKSVFLILLCFYLSYVGYLLFPAIGPRFTMHHLQSSDLQGLVLAEPLQRLLNQLEGIKRDAFPSGHTGVALVVSVLAFRFHRRFFLVTAPVVALLVFSTVYCRYHYVVDVIGGIGLAVLTFLIGDAAYGCWEEREHTDR